MYRFINPAAATISSISFLMLLSACADTSGPSADHIAASITPASAVEMTATVGTNVATRPSVLVKDASGIPIAGAIVHFSITAGGGTLSSSTGTTNSQGIASVSAWRLGTVAGLNTVIASIQLLPSIRFNVAAAPGPVATILKVAGDNQITGRGTAVPVRPQVKVMDAYYNPVSAVVVNFAIEAGGGSLSGENVTTDSLGIATLGSWTLGATGGQAIVAKAESLMPVMFRATTFETAEGCTAVAVLTQQTPLESELRVHACQEANGRFVNFYLVHLPYAGAWQFQLASAEFATLVELRTETGSPVASSRLSGVTTNSEINAILPAGDYVLVATSVDVNATGHYEISYASGSSAVAGCEVSIARGIQIAQDASYERCPLINDLYVDRYRIYLSAGSAVSIVLDDYSLSYNNLEIQDDEGNRLASGYAKDYIESTLDYTARVDGYYVISVQSTGKYDLDVR